MRGFDTDPSKPLTGGIQATGNYPGRARTPEELMAGMDKVLAHCPGTKKIIASIRIADTVGRDDRGAPSD